MNDAERIQKLINAAGGRTMFARKVGVSYTVVNEWYKGRMCTSFMRAIHEVFPWVSLNWLMFGEGKMTLETSKSSLQMKTMLDMQTKAGILLDNINKNIKELQKLETDE